MMSTKKRPPRVALLALLLLSSHAQAGKFDFAAGYFSLSAKSATSSGQVSNLGTLRVGYRHEVLPKLELAAGYTLNSSKILGGELAYGMDIGLVYFPFTDCCARMGSSGTVTYEFNEKWKPFVGLSFHQRQFQAVQASYPGVGGSAGVEYALTRNLSARGEVRVITLFGTSISSASESSFTGGMAISF
jgi:hypothetical protein